jgi:nitroreductase
MLKDVLAKRYTAKHWDHDRPIEQSKIDYILDCAYLSPSKMAAHLHKIILITDSPEGKKIKEWLYYGHTWHNNGKQGEENPRTITGFNGQYIAPIVIAWLNPKQCQEKTTVTYNGVETNVNLPTFTQRQNDIFLSSMCTMIAAEEQDLNTGFGSCHDHSAVAEHLGFPDYECPITVGIGYAKDMSEMEEKYGVLIPIFDPSDPTKQIGVDATNFQAHRTDNPNKQNTPTKESMIVTI